MASNTGKSSLVARRYASSLMALAIGENALEPVEKDLMALDEAIAEAPELRAFLQNPRADRAHNEQTFAALADQAHFHPLTRKFLNVLIHNRRLLALPDILAALRTALAEQRGTARADVVTAFPLSPEETQALQEKVSGALGQSVALDLRVDQSLLGGMVVTVGSRMYDDSVKHKLERLQRALSAPANVGTAPQKAQG